MNDLTAGWGFPANARKAHYFNAGEAISVCERWMYSGPREPETGERSPSDCVQCIKRLRAAAR